MIEFSIFKARCSSISAVTAESRSNPSITEKQLERLKELESKPVLTDKMKEEVAFLLLKIENSKIAILSDTYIGYLLEEYAWVKDQMLAINKDLDTHQTQKGILVEKDSVDLLNQVSGRAYKYNSEKTRIYNEYLSGEVDCWEGNSIMEAQAIVDLKNSFDYIGFLKKTMQPLLPSNKQQVQGYLLISGAPSGFIADTLLDTPDSIKYRIQQALFRKGSYISEESDDFLFDWSMYDRSMTFSDKFTPKQRVNLKPVEVMSKFDTDFLYDQVKRGRDFLNTFHEQRNKLL